MHFKRETVIDILQLKVFSASTLILLIFLDFANSLENGRECKGIRTECQRHEDCCTETCLANYCSDGLHRNSKDRQSGPADTSQLIATELVSGNNVDVSEHENINLLASLDECGWTGMGGPKRRRRKRIVGGTPYELGKYPWAASLHVNIITDGKSQFQCGASLISRRHILTAAHCVTRFDAGEMIKWVTLGNVDRSIKINCENNTAENPEDCNGKRYVDYEVHDWVVHESYSESHVRNDIALIRLKHEVNYTNYIQPICLPRSENTLKNWPNGKLTVIGWGTQNDPNDMGPQQASVRAQETDMDLVHRSICDRFFTRVIGKLRRSQICAGGTPSKGDCAGDSGSSLFKRLITENDDGAREQYFLVGLVSTGAVIHCARQGKPSVFTNIIYYMPWILDNLVEKTNLENLEGVDVPAVPKEEFKTGFNPPMDITSHKNINMLPKDCGKISGQQDHNGPANSHNFNGDAHKRVKRIVGGFTQSIGTFPWMAQIYTKNIITTDSVFRCSGVGDIRGYYVLDGVILGNFNRKDERECLGKVCVHQKSVPIEEIIVHEEFTKNARENDVALIKLSHEITFNRLINPICLPLKEDIIEKAWPNPEKERKYVAAGWGRVSGDSSEVALSNILVAANFTLESKRYCESVLVRKVGSLENSRVCGGGTSPGRGECIGDTGGPMMRWVKEVSSTGKTTARMYAFGILSVLECAHQGVPSLYQNLLYHMPWIMDHLSD